MGRLRLLKIMFACLLAFIALQVRASAPATQPASIEVKDVEGHAFKPLELGDHSAAVIVFIATECPVSNSYAPQINRLCEEYKPKHVAFYIVYSDPDLTDQAAQEHAKAYGYTCPALMDRKHALVHQLGPKVTPEVAVIGKDGALVYRGRIDNLYYAIGKRRPQATTHDLLDAIEATLAGHEASPARTRAVGCSISDD